MDNSKTIKLPTLEKCKALKLPRLENFRAFKYIARLKYFMALKFSILEIKPQSYPDLKYEPRNDKTLLEREF